MVVGALKRTQMNVKEVAIKSLTAWRRIEAWEA